jgi:hypothetical protein
LSVTEQIATIDTRDWYTAMRTQAGKIIKSMQDNQFNVPGDSWIETNVTGIYTRFQIRDSNVYLEAGQGDDGKPIYAWLFPAGWVA